MNPPIYPAVWQFGPNPNAMIYPAYANDALPNPGMVVGPPLQGPIALPPMPLTPPKGPIVQTNAQSVSCVSPAPVCAPVCAPDPVCCPPAACAPPEPYLVESTPWQPVRVHHCYVLADYLLWWTQRQSIPDETASGFPIFNLPDNGPRNGARLTVGSWLNPARTFALEASGFWLEDRTSSETVIQGANPAVIQLPFVLGIEKQTSSLETTSQFWGAEIDGRYKACELCGAHCKGYLDLLAGARYVDLRETMTFTNSTLFSVAPVEFSGALVNSIDSVGTHNQFYAPQVGFEAGACYGRLNFSVYGKIALGINQESVDLAGQTMIMASPLPLGHFVNGKAIPGGLLVQTPGHFSQNEFSYLPEAGLNFSFKICDCCLVGAGYSFLFLGNVVRPGDHFPASTGSLFPPSVLTFLGGPATAQPPFSFHQSNFWAQGGNFRITFIF
jgi:hypothetical protein